MNRKKYRQVKREYGVEIAEAMRDLFNKITTDEFISQFVNSIEEGLDFLRRAYDYTESFLSEHTQSTNQPSQDITKSLSPMISNRFIKVCLKNNISLFKKECNGSDLVYIYNGVEIDLEDKMRIFINGESECGGWTGNKNGGEKTDIHLLWGFSFSKDDKLKRIGFSAVSLSENGTQWKITEGSSSYSGLNINKTDNGILGVFGGWSKKIKYQYLEMKTIN